MSPHSCCSILGVDDLKAQVAVFQELTSTSAGKGQKVLPFKKKKESCLHF